MSDPKKEGSSPLFKYYGKLIEDIFSVKPSKGNTADGLQTSFRDAIGRSHDESNILDHGTTAERKMISTKIKAIDEKVCESASSDEGIALESFKIRLYTGKEQLLHDNQFYHLCKEFFIYHAKAAKSHFISLHKNNFPPTPKHEVAQRPAKIAIGLLTFLASMCTTAYGVDNWIQSVEYTFLKWLQGPDLAAIRMLLSFVAGFILSYVILDLKAAIFRGFMNAGKVFRGLRIAYFHNPVWLIPATFLTVISLKTNYDGGVAFISKASDLSMQSELIKKRVGETFQENIELTDAKLTSFFQTVKALHKSKEEVWRQFVKIPEDEASGVSSSGVAQQGPRYWGKFIVVYGGYKPGEKELIHIYKDTQLTRQIDRILQARGMSFEHAINKKIEKHINSYEKYLKRQKSEIVAIVEDLDMLMNMQEKSVMEAIRIVYLEYYDINEIVKKMIKVLENVEARYKGTVKNINGLINEHIQLLTQVDRSGGASAKQYEVKANFPLMDVSTVLALKKGIPRAKHKTFAELTAFLKDEYGEVLATTMMIIILALAVLVDLADPFIFGALIAREGRNEQERSPRMMSELKDWEGHFLTNCRSYFENPDLKKIFPGLVPKDDALLTDTFYRLLEEMNPKITDDRDKGTMWRFKERFFSGFTPVHTTEVAGYNARIWAIKRLLKKPELILSQYYNLMFPKLESTLYQPDSTLGEIYSHVSAEQTINRENFDVEQKKAVHEYGILYLYEWNMLKNEHAHLGKRLVKSQAKLDKILKKIEKRGGKGPKMGKIDYLEISKSNLEKEVATFKEKQEKIAKQIPKAQRKAEHVLKDGSVVVGGSEVMLKTVKSILRKSEDFSFSHTRRKWLAEYAMKSV